MPFGPLAATTIGVAIGNGGAKSAAVQHLHDRAVDLDLARRAARRAAARCSGACHAHVSGFCPIAMRPVKPVPIATTTRPGASCSSVAIALACVSGWRRFGTSTAGPSAMRDRALRGERRDHPDVAVQRGRVEQPRPLVAEPFGLDDVVDDVRTGRERAGDLHAAPT